MGRRIAIINGSDSDLPQCQQGLLYLKANNDIEVVGVTTASAHRNTEELLQKVTELVYKEVDAIIVGAGWANALTGLVDAFLRNTLKVTSPVVFGVAFVDAKNARHTATAILSILDVPGTQVVCDHYVGEEGFLRACKDAAEGELPEIKLKEPKKVIERTLDQAIEASKPTGDT